MRPHMRHTMRQTVRLISALAIGVALSACASAKAVSPQFIASNAPAPGPFSPAVRVGSTLYLSGQIGTDASGTLVKGGIDAETRQVMNNIKTVVEANGSTMDRVVKCTVFLADMKEWPAMNVVYATFFPNHKPARSAMGANGLARDSRVEIECIAIVGR